MQLSLRTRLVVRLIAFLVIAYGASIIVESLFRQLRLHPTHRALLHLNDFVVATPLVIGLTFMYLGSLLLRQKYNAWVAATLLFTFVLGLNAAQFAAPHLFDLDSATLWRHILVPLIILGGLVLERKAFRVRSDVRSLQQSLRFSAIILMVTLFYGVCGFLLLDRRDFHQEITVAGAFQRTVDQFGLTTNNLTPHTRRAKLFLDSLSVISVATGAYVAISFFQPLRSRLINQDAGRKRAEELLEQFPSDIDDFFKLWPHDKQYFFDKAERAGLAYHVTRGQALVVGDPFGDPKRFAILLEAFLELCFVNDWQPAFLHISDVHEELYRRFGFRLQKIGEEALLDLDAFQVEGGSKYFRQIRNRFTKLGYRVEILQSPHSEVVLRELRGISDEWLEKPGREERGFMLGYFSEDYLQRGPIAVATDVENRIKGFINLVPTFEQHMANYDLLRCSKDASGNCNDFLLLGLIEALHEAGIKTLNLGLTPLAGLDDKDEEVTLVNNALRFVYANGDRFYSFSGLRRFKEKYKPVWEDRYIAYRGGPASFTRTLTALNRAMKLRRH